MKRQLLLGVGVLVVCLAFISSINAQTAATVNWPLVSNRKPVVTGNVTADSALGIGGLSVKTYPTTVLAGPLGAAQSQWNRVDGAGTQINWPINNTDNVSPNVYIDFVVTPKAGYNFNVDSVKGWIGGMGSGNMRAHIFFGGTDTSFASLTQLNTAIFQLKQFSQNPPGNLDTAYAHYVGVEVKNGQKFRFRIYPWYKSATGSATRYILMQNVTIKGTTTSATDVESENILPSSFSLDQNYPNPFNPATRINFSLSRDGVAKLVVFNLIGQEVAALLNGFMQAGKHNVEFDASNLPTGVYIYRLITSSQSLTKKMMLIK